MRWFRRAAEQALEGRDFEAGLRNAERALDAGAEDVRRSETSFEVLCDPTRFQAVTKALTDARIATVSSGSFGAKARKFTTRGSSTLIIAASRS